jgi:hypothetical protein
VAHDWANWLAEWNRELLDRLDVEMAVVSRLNRKRRRCRSRMNPAGGGVLGRQIQPVAARGSGLGVATTALHPGSRTAAGNTPTRAYGADGV